MPSINHLARVSVLASALTTLVVSAQANPLLLFEPATGKVLYAEEPDRPWHPASVTKLMTAYLTFDAVKMKRLAWDDDVPLSDHARSQPATRIGLRAGIKLNVEQAVRGLILRSANDFAVALAERVGGTEEAFVRAMNDTAKRLHMTRTNFRNPHGLPDPEQITTARDLAILTTALLKDFPDRAEVFSTPTVRIHKGTFHSQNDLLRTLEGADGMKTGFTCASGYNIVASATRDGRRLVAIVLGEYNRQRRSTRVTELIEAGFAHLALDPKLNAEVIVPPMEAFKLRHAHAAAATVATTAHAFMPIRLHPVPRFPTEAIPTSPADIGYEIRARTCRGYAGFTKPEPEHDDGDDAEHIAAKEAGKAAGEHEAAKVATSSIHAKPNVARTAGQHKTAAATLRRRSKLPAQRPAVGATKPAGAATATAHRIPGSAPVTFGN